MSVQRPYGQWDSTVEADSYTQTSVQLSQVRVDETDTYWVEGNPRDNGRNTLLRADSMGQISEVLPLIDGIRLPDVRTMNMADEHTQFLTASSSFLMASTVVSMPSTPAIRGASWFRSLL